MQVDHGRAHVGVPEKFLDGADVGATLEEVRREAVSQGMGNRVFQNARPAGRPFESRSEELLRDVMSSDGSGTRIPSQLAGRKKPLPAELVAGIWKLALEGMGQEDTAQPVLDIVGVKPPDGINLSLEHVAGPLGQDRDAVLVPLSGPHDDVTLVEANVLDSETATFLMTQSGAVHNGEHEPGRALKMSEKRCDFISAKDDG